MEFVSRRDKKEVERILDAYLEGHHIGDSYIPVLGYTAVAGTRRSTVFKADEIGSEMDLRHLSHYLYVKEDKREYLILDWITNKIADGTIKCETHFITSDFFVNILLILNYHYRTYFPSLVGYKIDERYYDSFLIEHEPQSFFS